jgi:hypothetical protein
MLGALCHLGGFDAVSVAACSISQRRSCVANFGRLVELLLQNGARVESTGMYSWSALALAAKETLATMVQLDIFFYFKFC